MSIDTFLEGLPFAADRFQLEALAALEEGESVVVTAPTGAGKTLVAEGAVQLAVEGARRAFYTTPLKALSNQKYADFGARYGRERVGLLTGDNSINGDAPVVVMTTEVLRNMIYADSAALDSLSVVVLDEVHYLQDPARGAVWEEIIIHLPAAIRVVALSATVSNAAEFTDWVRTRRGATRLVVEKERPVPLEDLYLIGDRHAEGGYRLLPTFSRGRPNEKVIRLLGGRRPYRRFRTPGREAVAAVLADSELLPAIYFIFSRAGCEDAAERVAAAGLGLSTPAEAARIRALAEAGTAHLADEDLRLLGYDRWLSQLEAGVAAHHAGLVPAFKETVEKLFLAELVKIVFATETLSLGINMPARSVVLESLSKFTGEQHQLLTPGDYTQLTGRAGRRGIDELGEAVVLYSRFVPFDRVAAIAAAGSHPLTSSFRPTYNMAVNLIANYPQHRAEELLGASFAQFQRQTEMQGLEGAIARNRDALGQYEKSAECERGDVWELVELLESGAESVQSHRGVMREFASHLAPGDVLELPGEGGLRVLVARSWTSQPRLLLYGVDRRLHKLRPEQLSPDVMHVGRLELPEPFRPREAWFQQTLSEALGAFEPQGPPRVPGGGGDGHPVAGCPEAQAHLRWARRALRLRKELSRQERRLQRDRIGLVEELRSTLAMLDEWGHVAGWSLTDRGERLRFIYNELDLLITETALAGVLSDLRPPELAALASLFVYEPRRSAGSEPWSLPALRERYDETMELWKGLVAAEQRFHLTETRSPEAGFSGLAHAWAAGASLEDLFGEEGDFNAGDFVRTARQLIDLIRQLRDAFPALAPVARETLRAVDRGVVAAGRVV